VSQLIVNLEQAKFECTFGRGCDGVCCRNGRPPIYADEADRIDKNIHKFLPELRPEARAIVEKDGYLSHRMRAGRRRLRVIDGWCIFFNQGCVLHRIGSGEGDKFRYKPWVCATFPIARGKHDGWYVRQKGLNAEIWDLFCLDPNASAVHAADSLKDEIALVRAHAEQSTAPENRQLDVQ